MKKILFPLAAIMFSIVACNSTPKFTVNGTVEGQETGHVLLVRNNGQKLDTLTKAAINNGKFSLTGNVATITEAFLLIEGKRMSMPIILENANYTASFNLSNPIASKVEGPANQQLLNEFVTLSNEARMSQARLSQEFRTAMQEKNAEKAQQIDKEFRAISSRMVSKSDSLLHAHADSFFAAYLLSKQMNEMDFENLNKRFSALGENAKNSEPGQLISKKLQVLDKVQVGKVAPDFTMETPDGQQLSMHSIKAKVKIIDFWASWCGPCRKENPNVVKIYEDYHDKGLEILGVSLDRDKNAWLEAIKNDKLTWKHVSDLKAWGNSAAALYAVRGIPHMVILDENNVIVAKNLRGDALRAKIAEMLK